MSRELIIASLATAIAAATPVLIAATGELLAETVGVYNIGIEGCMLLGGLAGFVVGQETQSPIVGLLGALLAGAAGAFVFAAAVVVLRADMVVAGLALTFIGLGLSGVLGADYVRQPSQASLSHWNIPLLSDIPWVGRALFQQYSLTYLAFLLPAGVWFLLNRTRHGLEMRAIGEDPASADAVGVSVNGWRLFYVSVGGAFAGVAGAFLTLGPVGTWLPNVSAGEGYIALAIVIFASWKPMPLILGALLFGVLGTLGNVAQSQGSSIPSEVFTALPYIGTLASVCILAAIRTRRTTRRPWPAALGLPFFRGAS